MRSAFAIALLIPFLGCGDDTGTNPGDGGADASMLPDARPDAPSPDGPPQQMDAAPPQFNDAGAFTTPTTMNSVGCPNLQNPGTHCTTPAQHCCGSSFPPGCADPTVDGGACSAGFNEGCDGTEDCGSGEVCCGQMAGVSLTSTCASSCTTGQFRLCHNHTQCPTAAQACCTGMFMGFSLWFGYCTPPDMAPNGSQCDIP